MEDNSNSSIQNASLADQVKAYLRPSNIRMFFLGFSAGLPILLIFSSLSIWLREAGVGRSAVTYFSWAALGYSFKFVWAPLIDTLPVPFLTKKMGRRRSWLLVSQIAIAASILWMAMTDPAGGESSLTMMALAAVALGFSSATQDIVIDAFRIESDSKDMQAILSATYIASYRLAMIVSGAGALYLASYLGSKSDAYLYSAWQGTYAVMALFMLVGILTTLFSPEPQVDAKINKDYSSKDYSRILLLFGCSVLIFIGGFIITSDLSAQIKTGLTDLTGKSLAGFIVDGLRLATALVLAGTGAFVLQKLNLANRKMVNETYIDPIRDFFSRYKEAAIVLLLLVGLYRISDIVLGVISGVFYLDVGFSKDQIATAVKTVGVLMSILGGFIGGILTVRFGVIKILMLGGILAAGTNLLFLLLSEVGTNIPLFYVVVSTDNLAAGL
ncbi:MAG: MFS transporter, partial [Bdellovibrionaceae bacterium]|nr:MFS transporter [Pseudobdellovibrionaceae bacterium]